MKIDDKGHISDFIPTDFLNELIKLLFKEIFCSVNFQYFHEET